MDSTTRHWRFLREGHFDVAETSCSSYIVARDTGLPITAIPVFLHRRFRHGFVFINTDQGHQEAHRPDRQEDRHQVVSGHRDPLDARHPRARIRRLAQSGRMGRRARRGRRLHAAAGPQDHAAAARQVGRGHAGGGRGRRADPFRHHQADRGGRSARRRGCGRTTRPRRCASTRRRRSSRSCTSWASARRSSTAIPGCRSTCSTPSRSPRPSPCGGWRTRASCRSPGISKPGTSSRRCSAPIRGNTVSRDKNRHTMETIAGYSHEQGLTKRRWTADDLFTSVFQGRKRGDEFRI